MTERPILFTPPMAEAIHAGRKSVTRRVVKPHPTEEDQPWPNEESHVTWADILEEPAYYMEAGFCPYGKPGDCLWIKETWKLVGWEADLSGALILYKNGKKLWRPFPLEELEKWAEWLHEQIDKFAALPGVSLTQDGYQWESDDVIPWRASLFMPRWASCSLLEITAISPQKLHELTHEEALLEGIKWSPGQRSSPAIDFAVLWDSLREGSEKWGWQSNPWVWRIAFQPITS